MKSPFPLHLQTQDLAWLALGKHFKRTATHLAVGRKSLRRPARVDDQIKALAAKRAPNVFADFHVGLSAERFTRFNRIQGGEEQGETFDELADRNPESATKFKGMEMAQRLEGTPRHSTCVAFGVGPDLLWWPGETKATVGNDPFAALVGDRFFV